MPAVELWDSAHEVDRKALAEEFSSGAEKKLAPFKAHLTHAAAVPLQLQRAPTVSIEGAPVGDRPSSCARRGQRSEWGVRVLLCVVVYGERCGD